MKVLLRERQVAACIQADVARAVQGLGGGGGGGGGGEEGTTLFSNR